MVLRVVQRRGALLAVDGEPEWSSIYPAALKNVLSRTG